MTQAAIFNTDASRARTGEAFSDMFDGSAYGGYDPILPLVDDFCVPKDLTAFNDWIRAQMNPRFRRAHQRMAYIEKTMNEVSRNNPGFARSYLRKFTSVLYRREYCYPLKDGYVYNEDYDSTGTSYDWQSKFGEKVILLPADIGIPVSDKEFTVFVYADGRPLPPQFYDFYRQQNSFSVFIPYSHFQEGTVYTVEIRKFWNTPAYAEVRCTPVNTELGVMTFVVDENLLGTNFSGDANFQNDYVVYETSSDVARAKPLFASDYSIRRADNENVGKLIVTVRGAKLDYIYTLVNNSAGWSEQYVTTEKTKNIPLSYTGKHFPIVSATNELIVDTFEPEDETGMSFRLIPDVDYTLDDNTQSVGEFRSIRLVREVPANTVVRVTKCEPQTWIVLQGYLPLVDTHGIIEVQVAELPLDVSYMDVVMNNKVIDKSKLANILDTCFRIKEYDSSKYLYYRAAFPPTPAIQKLMTEYELYKPDLERFVEHVGFNTNIVITAGGSSGTDEEAYAFVYRQNMPEQIWIIEHNLGYHPQLAVVAALTGEAIDPDNVEHIDLNTIRLTFATPVAGIAKLI